LNPPVYAFSEVIILSPCISLDVTARESWCFWLCSRMMMMMMMMRWWGDFGDADEKLSEQRHLLVSAAQRNDTLIKTSHIK